MPRRVGHDFRVCVAAEPEPASGGGPASPEKRESPYKPLQHRYEYVDHRWQKNILFGDVERAERQPVRRVRSGHTRVEEGILFGTYNRVYRQRTEGNYRRDVSAGEQAARRYEASLGIRPPPCSFIDPINVSRGVNTFTGIAP